MHTYQYIGKGEVHIVGIGTFHSGDVFGSEREINHPEFLKVEDEKPSSKKSINSPKK